MTLLIKEKCILNKENTSIHLKNLKKEIILNGIAIEDKCAAPKNIAYLSKKREEKDYHGRNKINASCIRLSS